MTESNPRDFWTTLYQLKSIHRTGWLDRGISSADSESVADHSLLTTIMAWLVAHDDVSLDANKVLQLALIHDVAESIAGDMPPYDPEDIPEDVEGRRAFFSVRLERTPQNAARKRAIEGDAASQILGMLPKSAQKHWSDLWHEYESQQSPESQFVKQVDRLEVFIQSRLYAERFPEAPVSGFTDMVLQAITHPLLIPIRDAFLDDSV